MERHPLRSLVANFAIEELGEPEDQWEEFAPFDVNVLAAERTLLEKLSAVHTIASDPAAMESALAGWGRHIYDIHKLLTSTEVRDKLAALGHDEIARINRDIETRSTQAGWAHVERPEGGYTASAAFDSNAPAAAAVRRAYEVSQALLFEPAVPLEDCVSTVRRWAHLL